MLMVNSWRNQEILFPEYTKTEYLRVNERSKRSLQWKLSKIDKKKIISDMQKGDHSLLMDYKNPSLKCWY